MVLELLDAQRQLPFLGSALAAHSLALAMRISVERLMVCKALLQSFCLACNLAKLLN